MPERKIKLSTVVPTWDELLPTDADKASFNDASASLEAGHYIRNLRKDAGLTQLELAERMNVSQARVSAIENGEGRDGPTYAVLKRVAVACRATPLLGGGERALREARAVQTKQPLPSRWGETLVAVYDTAAYAELAVQDLLAANVPQSAINRHAAEGSYSAAPPPVGTRSTGETGGFWSNLFGGSSEDHTVYDRTVESGGTVVTVSTIPEHDYEAIMTILEKHNPVDIDERAASYSTSGAMTTGAAASAMGADEVRTGSIATSGASMNTGAMGTGAMGTGTMNTGTMNTGTMSTGAMSTGAMSTGTTMNSGTMSAGTGAAAYNTGVTAEQSGTIQLAEEQLVVGKRLVNRGGTRVRRYVVETPVEENVTLHEEKVTLERRPVTDGRPVTDADFTDRTIELTETAEEAVVSKTARVVEEVSLGKTATDHTETIRDTLRKDEIKVEPIRGSVKAFESEA